MWWRAGSRESGPCAMRSCAIPRSRRWARRPPRGDADPHGSARSRIPEEERAMAMNAEATSREGRAVGEDGVPNPVMHHVNLKTTRLGELIDWYGEVCGMRPNFRSEAIAFLTNDAANH